MARSNVLVLALAVVSISACATAQSTIAGGGSPPALRAPDGGTVTLGELVKDREATVLVFWSSTCPCVRRYQERVDGLIDRYPADRVRIIAVSSNAGESYEKVLKIAKDRGVRIPVYRDEGGGLARYLGAKSTPTVVVLGPGGDVRFFGWLDNEHMPGESGREPWLESALDGILAGKGDFSARTPTFGCVITKSVFGSQEPVQQSCSHCQNH